MALQIQLRRGTASAWTSANPVLMEGEMGVETDTLKVKLGDGSTAWNSLTYFTQGATGATGPANELSIGTVTTGAAGSSASATITGTAPDQTLSLTIPRGNTGAKGDQGDTGPANTLTIGTVTFGETASATITGTAPDQTLNLVLPQGEQGVQGVQGEPGEGVPVGGTTGQILAKASGTDYDTEWTDMPPSALASQSDVTITSPSDKQVLKYDGASSKWTNQPASGGITISSSSPSAPGEGDAWFYSDDGSLFVRYNDGSSTQWVQASPPMSAQVEQRYYSPNYLINGGFDIWQRGTGPFSPSGGAYIYTADRWAIFREASAVNYSIKQLTSADSLPDTARFAARMQRTAGDTSTAIYYLGAALEGAHSIVPLQGQTVTFSFYARKGANFSSTNLNFLFESGTGSDAGFTIAVTSPTQSTASFSLTTSWVRYSTTFTIPTGKQTGRFYFHASPTGTAGAADYFDVSNVQLEIGSTATAFRRNANSLQGELAACQRYYYQIDTTPYYSTGRPLPATRWGSTAAIIAFINHPVPMRAAPSVSASKTSARFVGGGTTVGATFTPASDTFIDANTATLGFSAATTSASGGWIDQFAVLSFSAEL